MKWMQLFEFLILIPRENTRKYKNREKNKKKQKEIKKGNQITVSFQLV